MAPKSPILMGSERSAFIGDTLPQRSYKDTTVECGLEHRVALGGAKPTFPMNRTDRPFQAFPAYDNGDGQFARTLRDGDDVDVIPRDCREDPSREAGSAAHPLTHYCNQSDI